MEEKRGFTRISNIEYNERKKFLCGIIMNIKGMDYFAPVSSKISKGKNNVVINENGRDLASIKLSFMFPVPKRVVKLEDFSILDKKEYNLIIKELLYCHKNSDKIKERAMKVYNTVKTYNVLQ